MYCWSEYLFFQKPCSHLRFKHDSTAICDGDVIILRLDCDSKFEPHLKFLANRIYFDNLRASLVVLGEFLDGKRNQKKKT